MENSKVLLNISKLEDINYYKELGYTNFLLPLRDYTIGYKDFSMGEIAKVPGNVYVLSNRLLTDEDIDEFLKLNIPKNVKGFIVEDIGLYMVLKDKGYNIINHQNHLNNNYKTINIMLENYDSLVLSTDITLEEINEILAKCTKPLVLNTFGKSMVMYSRRRLISNYRRHYGKDDKDYLNIKLDKFSINFDLVENYYGTAIFNKEFTDYRKILERINNSKIKYYLIDTNFLSKEEIKKVLEMKDILNTTDGFLYKKTIYKVGDKK